MMIDGVRSLLPAAALVPSLFLLAGMAAAAGFPTSAPTSPTKEEVAKYAKAKVTLETSYGNIVLRFFPGAAPIHVKNFITLAESGFYDGTIFHRVIPGFMIQGGDPKGKDPNARGVGTGGPGYTIKAEFNDRSHKRGVLSMARSNDPNSAGSQFFVCVADAPHLDRQYTAFGQVESGMEAVDKIVALPRDGMDKPAERVEIKKATVTYQP
jgi:peptidyl-prolyl cis-trans isomerase B (cyclophilin B)